MTTLNVDIDSLLDGTLDDLADMPEFKPLPAGAHRLTLNFETKQISDKPAIEVKLTVVETVELSNPAEDQPAAAGDNTNIVFFLDNELGQGQFKQVIATIREHSGDVTSTNRQIMENNQGIEVLAVTGIRTNKKDKTQKYTSLQSFQVL